MHSAKNIISFAFLNCLPIVLLANSYLVTGSVVDVETKKPVYGASVFINNSAKGCFTDSAGNFIIPDVEEVYFDLVVVKQGFETIVYRFTKQPKNKRIRFEISAETVNTPIKPDINSKAEINEWRSVFANRFLSNTDNALGCYIANPDALKFVYNPLSHLLFVSSTEPLQIFNESLGYMIICDLQKCVLNYNNDIHYEGYFWFKELTTKRKEIAAKWKLNRTNTYSGSLLHFMQAFYAGKVLNEGFVIKSVTRIYEDENPFDYNYVVKKYKLAVTEEKPNTGNTTTVRKCVDVVGNLPINKIRIVDTVNEAIYLSSARQLIISYNRDNKPHPFLMQKNEDNITGDMFISSITLKDTNSIRIESNGSFFEPLNLIVKGYWESKRMADMLPVDYNNQPNE